MKMKFIGSICLLAAVIGFSWPGQALASPASGQTGRMTITDREIVERLTRLE